MRLAFIRCTGGRQVAPNELRTVVPFSCLNLLLLWHTLQVVQDGGRHRGKLGKVLVDAQAKLDE